MSLQYIPRKRRGISECRLDIDAGSAMGDYTMRNTNQWNMGACYVEHAQEGVIRDVYYDEFVGLT